MHFGLGMRFVPTFSPRPMQDLTESADQRLVLTLSLAPPTRHVHRVAAVWRQRSELAVAPKGGPGLVQPLDAAHARQIDRVIPPGGQRRVKLCTDPVRLRPKVIAAQPVAHRADALVQCQRDAVVTGRDDVDDDIQALGGPRRLGGIRRSPILGVSVMLPRPRLATIGPARRQVCQLLLGRRG